MKIKYLFIILLYAGFVSCGQSGKSRDRAHSDTEHNLDHDHDAENEHELEQAQVSVAESSGDHHDRLIELSPEAVRAAGIATATAERRNFSAVIPATGEILPMQGDVVTVTAKSEGIVMFDAGRIFSGMPVGGGEKVMTITSQGVTRDSYVEAVLQAEITYNQTRLTYERNRELYADQLVTQSELQNSEAEFRAAELRYNNLRADFEQGGLRVSSPVKGYMTEILVGQGDFVSLGQPLFTVSQNRDVVLRVGVSPRYAERLPQVVNAHFRTSASDEFRSVAGLGGKITSYGRAVESATLLIPVYFSLPYSADYPAGSYVEARLLVGGGSERVVLPKEAVVEDFGHFFVYVSDEHGFERRDVVVGGSDGIYTEILSGVNEGEEVVVSGATRLKLVERLGSLGEESAHAGHSH